MLQDRLDGAWLARYIAKIQKYRLGQNARQHREHRDRLLFRGTLEDYGIEFVDPPGDLGKRTQRGRRFFEALVQRCRTLEIERFTRGFAIAFELLRKGLAGSRKRRKHSSRFEVVFLFRATRETRREAHFHL